MAPAPHAATLAPSAFALPLGGDRALALADSADGGEVPAAHDGSRRGRALAALRSAAVPGWGEWHDGYRDLGLGFLALEAACVATAAVSVGQGQLRERSYEQQALDFAGIDLNARDGRFRKLVSDYRSSDDYNRLVVYRNAAALYYGDFEKFNQYIDEHSLTGAEAWSWESDDQWLRYRALRQSSQRAFHRARFAVAGMVVNRVASAIVAAALARDGREGAALAPGSGGLAAGSLEWSVAPAAERGWEHRLAWVHRF